MKEETWQYTLIGAVSVLAAVFLGNLFFRKPKEPPKLKHQELQNQYSELNKLINEDSEEGWVTVKDTPNLKVMRKETGSSPVAIIKAQMTIENTTPEKVHFCIWDGNYRRQWDTVIKDFKVLETFSENSDLIYFYAQSPVPRIVANREFLQRRGFRKQGNSIEIVYYSADRPDIPTQEGWVRAQTIISGYTIQPVPGTTNVCVNFISQNDVKGLIPPKLINAFAPKKATEWIKKLAQACSNLNSSKVTFYYEDLEFFVFERSQTVFAYYT